MQALGKRAKSTALAPRRVFHDDTKGIEEEVGPRKVPRTELDLTGITQQADSHCREMWLVKVPVRNTGHFSVAALSLSGLS